MLGCTAGLQRKATEVKGRTVRIVQLDKLIGRIAKRCSRIRQQLAYLRRSQTNVGGWYDWGRIIYSRRFWLRRGGQHTSILRRLECSGRCGHGSGTRRGIAQHKIGRVVVGILHPLQALAGSNAAGISIKRCTSIERGVQRKAISHLTPLYFVGHQLTWSTAAIGRRLVNGTQQTHMSGCGCNTSTKPIISRSRQVFYGFTARRYLAG